MAGVAGLIVVCVAAKGDLVAGSQQHFALFDLTDADLRPRQILKDRDGAPTALRCFANKPRGFGVEFVRTVAEVEPRNVHSGIDHRQQHFGIGRSGADCGNDFGAALGH